MTDKMTEEMKIELIKMAINSKEGWKNLAQSVKNISGAKEQCIELLRKIGGDREVDLPVISLKNSKIEAPTDTIIETVKVKFADLLVQQLEENISKLD